MAVKPIKGPFTVDEYHRLGELGILHEDDRVELIDGEIVEMNPIGPPHGGCVNRLTELFSPLAGHVATLSVQNPVVLAEYQEPQPDFVVLKHRADGYGTRHPRPADVLLIVEVADTSAESDRRKKIPRYARTGISEVWLVDLQAGCIEVYQSPGPDGYADLALLARGATLTPLALSTLRLEASDILG